MFSVVGASFSEVPLQPPEYSPVKWLEGVEVNDTAPRYLITSQRFRGALDDVDVSTLLIKIGDMGGGNVAFILHRHAKHDWCQILTPCPSHMEHTMRPVAGDADGPSCT